MDKDPTAERANDNRSFTSVMTSPDRQTADHLLGEALLSLKEINVPDHVLVDSLFQYLRSLLQPEEPLTGPSVRAYYSQLSRLSGELTKKVEAIEGIYQPKNLDQT